MKKIQEFFTVSFCSFRGGNGNGNFGNCLVTPVIVVLLLEYLKTCTALDK